VAFGVSAKSNGPILQDLLVSCYYLGLVRLIPLPMDWMRLEKIKKKFDLLGF
jgi:hypothetical protein